ncbi:MAG TPA: Fic family protein [Stellaceae bacterium]|nr:Fic family protein [Stellaceae bacterium]
MYEAVADPYCYEGTDVLKNIPGIRDRAALEAFETVSTTQRADEPLPAGRLGMRHYQVIHRHLFQDVYSWAGKFRIVRIGKGNSTFCYPEHIEAEMRRLFSDLKQRKYLRGLSKEHFAAEAARFLASLNAIHPFRDGNGRTQMVFLVLLAARADHVLNLDRLVPERFMNAMIASFYGNESLLADELARLTA